MIATLIDETLEVVRRRLGVLWCPFCDTSTPESQTLACSKCGAVFGEAVVAPNDDDTLSTVPTTDATGGPKVLCEVEGCGRLISTMPAAQATHRKAHEVKA